jgi:hypothetical protein
MFLVEPRSCNDSGRRSSRETEDAMDFAVALPFQLYGRRDQETAMLWTEVFGRVLHRAQRLSRVQGHGASIQPWAGR